MAKRAFRFKELLSRTHTHQSTAEGSQLAHDLALTGLTGEAGHTGLQLRSEKGLANGYASLDANADVPDAQIPDPIARDAELATASATVTTLDGVGTAGAAASFSRGDHEHPLSVNLAGTLAARPAVSAAGVLYFATDIGVLFRDTGAAWVAVSPAAPQRVMFLTGAPTNSAQVNVWTNMPAAETEFGGSLLTRQWVELTYARQFRFLVRVGSVPGPAGCVLRLKYAASDAGPFTTLGVDQAVDVVGTFKTAWTNVPAGAQADVILSLWGAGGDGVADPVFGVVSADFRT